MSAARKPSANPEMRRESSTPGRRKSSVVPAKEVPPLTDKRPDAKQYTKWEKHLPLNLEDFMNQYVAWKPDGTEHPEWKQDVVLEFETDITNMVAMHMKSSATSRKLLGSMNVEDVWLVHSTYQMFLTKRNLATLDPNFIPDLNAHILGVMTKYIEDIRQEVRHILDAIYASPEERAATEARMAGLKPENYLFECYGAHLELQKEMHTELKNKFPVIQYTRKRELWVQNLVAFETENMKVSAEKCERNCNNPNWLPKFRMDASEQLIQSNTTAPKMMHEYKEATGKEFMVNGLDYKEEFFKKQKAQLGSIKTNFRYLTADVLYYDNPTMGAHGEGEPIVQKVLHDSIASIVEDVAETEPPSFPEWSAELNFLFEYY